MGTHKLIYIRTDGNKHIASGHLTRCLSIAAACRQLAMDVRFLVSDEESFSLLRGMMEPRMPFPVSRLKTASYNHPEQELAEIIHILSSHSADTTDGYTNDTSGAICDASVTNQSVSENEKPVFLLDSYYVTKDYLCALKSYAKIVYLDDLQLFDYPVHLLINYDIIPDSKMLSCQSFYRNAGRLLLGAAYTPLRSQFQGKQISVNKRVENILITTGGSDPYHFCLTFIHWLKRLFLSEKESAENRCLTGIIFHIVIGKLNTDKELLYESAANMPFVRLHENVTDMAALMLGCDLAVSAAGTTLYELCALGVPSISFTMADNQQTAAAAFSDIGVISCAGDLREDFTQVLEAVFQFLHNSCSDNSFTIRKSARSAMRGMVDGNGALRIAEAIQNL